MDIINYNKERAVKLTKVPVTFHRELKIVKIQILKAKN